MPINAKRASTAGDLKALGHPLRLSLLDLLMERGPLTATDAAGALAQTPANVSWHLRKLAEQGFVRQASAGPGRRRPWKIVTEALALEARADIEQPHSAAFSDVQIEREVQVLRRAQTTDPGGQWSGVARVVRRRLRLDADEAVALARDLDTVLTSYEGRTGPQPRNADRRRVVAVVSWVVPVEE